MKLKQVFKLSFTVFLIFILASCSDSSDYTQDSASSDAQIYGFKLTGKPITSIDTVNYPVMAKTKFAINQFSMLIYNPDSLPYKTNLRRFATTIAFNESGVSKVQLLYDNDSVATWESTSDSIDYSLHPQFKITAADGYTTKTYTLDIRIHQVDPDLMIWENVTSQLKQPASIVTQKTLLRRDITGEGSSAVTKEVFYTFSVDNDNKLYLHKADKGSAYAPKEAMTGLPQYDLFDLQSITLYNDKFYAIDTDRKGYSSSDGVAWEEKGSGIYNIIGVIPADKAENDSLLVITENAGEYSFAKTNDMETLNTVRVFNTSEKDKFPVSGFSSVTNFDRDNLNKNLLILTGGVNGAGSNQKLTWLVQVSNNNVLRLTTNQDHSVFSASKGIVNFMYDDHLYALTLNKLYKSISFGYKWALVPESETLDSGVPKASAQSVIVDSSNYIWIFGGKPDSGTPKNEVWRGRLNRLNPKN